VIPSDVSDQWGSTASPVEGGINSINNWFNSYVGRTFSYSGKVNLSAPEHNASWFENTDWSSFTSYLNSKGYDICSSGYINYFVIEGSLSYLTSFGAPGLGNRCGDQSSFVGVVARFIRGACIPGYCGANITGAIAHEFAHAFLTTNHTTSPPYTWSWNTASATNDVHTLLAKAYDSAGNVTNSSIVNVTVDNLVPSVSITTPTSGASVSGTVNIAAAASDNITVTNVEFLVDGVVKGSDTTSPYNYSWNTTVYPNGSHTLTANAYDAAGNISTSISVNVNVNNTVPDTQAPTVPANLIATAVSATQVNLSWNPSTGNVGVVGYKIFRNSIQINTSATTNFGDATVVANTTYTYTVSAYDAAGNTSAASNPATVTTPQPADTQNPSVVITNLASNTSVSGTVNISATAFDNVGVTKVEFFINGDLVTTDTSFPYNYSWNTLSFPNNTYQISAKAHDAAGNTTTSTVVTVTVNNGNSSADINGDTKINVLDLSILLSKWGTSDGQADLNKDLVVNTLDLSMLLSNWSP